LQANSLLYAFLLATCLLCPQLQSALLNLTLKLAKNISRIPTATKQPKPTQPLNLSLS